MLFFPRTYSRNPTRPLRFPGLLSSNGRILSQGSGEAPNSYVTPCWPASIYANPLFSAMFGFAFLVVGVSYTAATYQNFPENIASNRWFFISPVFLCAGVLLILKSYYSYRKRKSLIRQHMMQNQTTLIACTRGGAVTLSPRHSQAHRCDYSPPPSPTSPHSPLSHLDTELPPPYPEVIAQSTVQVDGGNCVSTTLVFISRQPDCESPPPSYDEVVGLLPPLQYPHSPPGPPPPESPLHGHPPSTMV